jgi:3-deoxy-D-manno-octulosonic-acid transferase
LLAPFIILYLLWRVYIGKEDKKRYLEKLAYIKIPRPQGKLMWFHTASVGELNSIIPLIKELAHDNKNLNFLITTATINSEKIFQKANLPKTIHQFIPLDIPWYVKRFINHWKIDLAIFVDSELWPNIITEISKRKKIILVNGRLSDRSFNRWKYLGSLIRYMYSKFTLIMPTSKVEEEKISYFAKAKKIKYYGNLKNAVPPLTCSQQELEKLKKKIGKRPFWLAASTHKGEEEQILSCHKQLAKNHKELLTIIIPRHPQRGEEVASLANNSGFKYAIRSKKEEIKDEVSVYIANTMGEMGLFYNLADIVFVGGSLIPHGGQNTLEPAKLNCAIIVGPNTANFKEVTNTFLNHKAIKVIDNKEELAVELNKMFKDKQLVKTMAKNAFAVTQNADKILSNVKKELEKHLHAAT